MLRLCFIPSLLSLSLLFPSLFFCYCPSSPSLIPFPIPIPLPFPSPVPIPIPKGIPLPFPIPIPLSPSLPLFPSQYLRAFLFPSLYSLLYQLDSFLVSLHFLGLFPCV